MAISFGPSVSTQKTKRAMNKWHQLAALLSSDAAMNNAYRLVIGIVERAILRECLVDDRQRGYLRDVKKLPFNRFSRFAISSGLISAQDLITRRTCAVTMWLYSTRSAIIVGLNHRLPTDCITYFCAISVISVSDLPKLINAVPLPTFRTKKPGWR